MELKCTNPNGVVVLAKILNHVELLFLKKCKNCIPYKLFFSKRCYKCPKNKIVRNFLITNPSGMNQNFLDRQKYNLWEKKWKKMQFFAIFFVAPSPLFWAYLDITFVPGHQLKKNNIPTKLISFSIFKKKFQKIRTKIHPIGTCLKSHLSPEGTTVL